MSSEGRTLAFAELEVNDFCSDFYADSHYSRLRHQMRVWGVAGAGEVRREMRGLLYYSNGDIESRRLRVAGRYRADRDATFAG
jgi:hypothetical protein